MSQGIATPSFEIHIPSFFSTSTTHKITKDTRLYLDTIVDYAVWIKYANEFKDALKVEISDFEISHT